MADLTEEQMKSYWRYNLTLITVLLSIGLISTDFFLRLWSGRLYQLGFIGFPLGKYLVTQKSSAIFAVEIVLYVRLMNNSTSKNAAIGSKF